MPEFFTAEQAAQTVRQLEKICSIRPTPENLSNLSSCYFALGATEEALKVVHLAFEKDPNNPAIVVNLGLIMKEVGDMEGAFKCFSIAFNDLGDESAYTRLAYSEALLYRGNWKDAWPLYDTSRPTKEAAALACSIPISIEMWDGKKKPDRLLVVDEGGAGDRIFYSRWLPKLTEAGIDWVYFPAPEVRGFFERVSWCKNRLIKENGEMLATHWTTTFSLPANLGTTLDSIPAKPERLFPMAKYHLKYKLSQDVKSPIVGLCWSHHVTSSGARPTGSLSEGQAMRLVSKTDHLVCWVNLNHARALPYPVENPRIETLEELAGLMSNMTEIVSIAGGPACLADAMNLPLTVLLATNCDWKFSPASEKLFPNTNIIRNGTGGGMENTVERAIEYINSKYGKSRLHLVGD